MELSPVEIRSRLRHHGDRKETKRKIGGVKISETLPDEYRGEKDSIKPGAKKKTVFALGRSIKDNPTIMQGKKSCKKTSLNIAHTKDAGIGRTMDRLGWVEGRKKNQKKKENNRRKNKLCALSKPQVTEVDDNARRRAALGRNRSERQEAGREAAELWAPKTHTTLDNQRVLAAVENHVGAKKVTKRETDKK